MKKEIPLAKANRLINCGPVVLVTAAYQEKANITTIAWCMPVSHSPSLVGVAIAKKHLSRELIMQSQEFAVNIPTMDLLDAVLYCGSHSGRDVNKFEQCGLHQSKAQRLTTTPLIQECIGHIEFRVSRADDAGDHTLFLGESLAVSAEEDLFSDVWNTEKAKLIFHLGGKSFVAPGPLVVV